MEKNIKKRVCRLAAVLSTVLVVLFGYWFFLNPHGYWQKQKETEREEYSERRMLWRKSEAMTMQRMLQDLTLLANGDSVLVCEACYLTLPAYRDFIHGTAQPKRIAWVNLRYRYGLYLLKGREKMEQEARDRNYKSIVFWSERRLEVQKDSTKDYRKEKPIQIEVEQNALYPALGKPSDEAFEKWMREYKSLFTFPKISNSKRWVKIPFLE